MEQLLFILQLISAIGVVALVCLNLLLRSYASEKGKNLATKRTSRRSRAEWRK
jgi:hypothetical protein